MFGLTGSAVAIRWIGDRAATMLRIGADNFRAMLSGFHAMDEHFRSAPPIAICRYS
jgi:glucose-6-phosphate isomerase